MHPILRFNKICFTHSVSRYANISMLFVLTALGGCGTSVSWDQEFSCSGQEQSTAYFTGDDASKATEKQYPNTIDFHLRGNNVMVKSLVAAVDTKTAEEVTFSRKNGYTWISGKLDRRDGRLTVVDGRTLNLADRTQQIRTTGQYTCRQAGHAGLISTNDLT